MPNVVAGPGAVDFGAVGRSIRCRARRCLRRAPTRTVEALATGPRCPCVVFFIFSQIRPLRLSLERTTGRPSIGLSTEEARRKHVTLSKCLGIEAALRQHSLKLGKYSLCLDAHFAFVNFSQLP